MFINCLKIIDNYGATENEPEPDPITWRGNSHTRAEIREEQCSDRIGWDQIRLIAAARDR